jgi:hypothetical protein
VTINKERLKLAVDALRSGEYRQAMNTLVAVDDNGDRSFCCLGVMCDVALKNGIEGVEEFDRTYDVGYRNIGEGADFWIEYSVLPKLVRDWYGFDRTLPMVMVDEDDHELTYLNDDRGWDFERIADAIEATYLTGEK